jgi:CheY-like chemotaxis protein
MQCPRCEIEAPGDAQFCPECGAKLILVCAQCGASNAVGHKFCKACGQPLGAAAPADAPPPSPPADAGPRRLVLVADDDPAIRDLVSDVLAEAGFRTVRAADGSEVVPLALKYRPAIVVMDVIMPNLDGYTTMTRLRNHPATKDIPVVMLTGQAGSLYQTLSFGVGATAHLTKPFSPRQLMDTVEQVLQGRPADAPDA